MTQRHKPRLCIGLPVYNGEEYLAQAVESVLGQTFDDFRLIISDNASTDGTEEICRSYAQRDSRVEYHRVGENRGAAWNFNRVVGLADSEYFQWATHDDVWAPDLVRRCVEVLDRNPRVVLCYPRSQIIDERGEFLRTYDNRVQGTAATPYERFKDVLIHLDLCHMLLGVIRHDVLRQTRLHGAYPSSDRIFIAEIALRGEFHEVEEILFFRRDHPARPARACRCVEEHAVWFDPANAGRIMLLRWIFLANYLRTIARAPIPVGQKLRCLVLMTQWLRWNSHLLREDLAYGAKSLLRRTVGSWLTPSRRSGSDA